MGNPTLNFLLFIAIVFVILVFVIEFYKREKLERRLSQAGIDEIDLMDGVEFEKYLEVIFKKLGYQVKRTPASNDFGADLILDEPSGGRIVIQAKRYQRKVGVKAVQEVNAARDYYHAQEAWVITNNLFSEQATKLAEASQIKLMDRYELAELILHTKEDSQSFRNTNKKSKEKIKVWILVCLFLVLISLLFLLI